MTKKNIRRGGDTRRQFLKKTASAIAVSSLGAAGAAGQGEPAGVVIVPDRGDYLMQQPPGRLALEELTRALASRAIPGAVRDSLADVPSGSLCIFAAGKQSVLAREVLSSAGAELPDAPESLALVRGQAGSRPVLLASGSDSRGLAYALRELADVLQYSPDPLGRLRRLDGVVETPANAVRSTARLFTSELEDKSWFYDKSFWSEYLGMLMSQRFNRFSLTLGLGYNSPHRVRDSYFYFAYPFLLKTPGYEVRAAGLPDQQRDRNLSMLQWISEQATAVGLHFQLALWTHAYRFVDSPDVNYVIEGLTPQQHAAYCRDALRQLLEACPAIQGVTFRCHSESGIPEGSLDFWGAVFDGVKRAGRQRCIDIHSKGIDHELLDMAVRTGLPVTVSPKYWAEHMGLPYHQAAIRELERRPPPAGAAASLERQRRFTRYGYGDYLREDRRYGVIFRIWPGTQRLLLWGDPALAAGYGRYAQFCGSQGLELCEPLSFKGRMGSGVAGRRDAYADASLAAAGGDWRKHQYTYRLWGRLLYDPAAPEDGVRRFLEAQFGAGARDCQAALAAASRVLPLLTTAHGPSASNNTYWPEMYANMPIVDADRSHPYGDTPDPKRFGAVSPFDPALFSSVDEFAAELESGARSGEYSPLDVARWLDGLARKAEQRLARARARVAQPQAPEFRRWDIDIRIQAGIGRFFAEKFRAALAWRVFQRSGERALLDEAVQRYRAARNAWAELARVAQHAYVNDITFGLSPQLRGHWTDRLAAIDEDLADLQQCADRTVVAAAGPELMKRFAELASGDPLYRNGPDATRPRCEHLPAPLFRRGEPLSLELGIEAGYALRAARLHYRRVNQAEAYQTMELAAPGDRYRFVIPAPYADSPYPLAYYFELHDASGNAWLMPAFNDELSNQPYFLVRQARS